MKLLRILLLLVFTLSLAACASDKTVEAPGAAFKGMSEDQLYNSAEQSLLSGYYHEAVKKFQGLDALYPFGKHAQKAQLDVIYAYYKVDDVPSTLAAADRYIHLYPMGKYTDYAYYMRGLSEFYQNRGAFEAYFSIDYSQRDLEPLRQAFLDFSRLVYRYPHSRYTPDARLRMIYIRNIIARHYLELAYFYFDRGAYVGAVNRANEVIQHFGQSTSMPGALVMATESYIKLRDFKNALQNFTVLKMNFPHDPSIPKLQKELSVGISKYS